MPAGKNRGRGTDHQALSITMLQRILQGASYRQVGVEFQLSHSSVEQRVKTIVRHLLARGDVVGLDRRSVPYLHALRSNQRALMDALEHLKASQEPLTAAMGPERIDEAAIDTAVSLLRYRSPQPDRDVAMFLLMLATGALPLEIARLRVSDYLNEEGAVRRVSVLHSGSAGDRPVYFTSGPLNEALSTYLTHRLRKGWGRGNRPGYRGLDPDTALFLDARGRPFEVTLVREGQSTHWSCPQIHQTLRMLFQYADWRGASASMIRHWLANRLLNLGASLEQVSQAMGVRNLKTWKRCIEPHRSLELITGGVL